MKQSLIAITAALALLALSVESDTTIKMLEADALPAICAAADPETETPEQYAACDDLAERLSNFDALPPVIPCDTDFDCQTKNPEIARSINYQAY